jgi:phosphoadenosine phosphosulfate reductase
VIFGDTKMEFPDTYDVIDRIEAQCKDEGIEFYRASSHFEPEESCNVINLKQLLNGI